MEYEQERQRGRASAGELQPAARRVVVGPGLSYARAVLGGPSSSYPYASVQARAPHDRGLGRLAVVRGRYPHLFLRSVYSGVYASALRAGCNLLMAGGVGPVGGPGAFVPAWPEPSMESQFIPVGPWNTDGLIVITPLLSENRLHYIQQLLASKFPLVFVGTGEGGPSVDADNESGIRQGLAHLVEHGHRRVAFIAGYESDAMGDSADRLRAFRSAVHEFGLEAEDRLIAYGLHNHSGGRVAMQRILASGVAFTAVQASNDVSAIGAVQVLRDAGRRVPQDVAVVGFDHRLDAVAHVPSLTSVQYSGLEAGQRALNLLLEYIDQKRSRPDLIRVRTQLVIGQSCGCLPGAVNPMSLHEVDGLTSRAAPAYSQARLVQAMAAALPAGDDAHRLTTAEHLDLCSSLVKGFESSVERGHSEPFRLALSAFIRRVEETNDDLGVFQAAISVLRSGLPGLLEGLRQPSRRGLAEDLLHEARTAISESVGRRDSRRQLEERKRAIRIGLFTARLFAAQDAGQILEALAAYLSASAMPGAQVAFYEPAENDPFAWSVPLSAPDQVRQRFLSREFPPPELRPPGAPFQLALIPLLSQEELIGYMAFDAGDLELLATLARQLMAALRSVRLQAQVRELSLTDGLTGLYNRRYLEIVLQNDVEHGLRYGRDLAVIMLDLDHFKEYNDTFGHPAGDRALQQVARCLRQVVRASDVIARYGGEEFMVVLPETDVRGAVSVAEDIRASVAGLVDLEQRLTISLGVAALQPDQDQADALIKRADQALYQAKRSGRNRVRVFKSE